jgi:hypothetical protein
MLSWRQNLGWRAGLDRVRYSSLQPAAISQDRHNKLLIDGNGENCSAANEGELGELVLVVCILAAVCRQCRPSRCRYKAGEGPRSQERWKQRADREAYRLQEREQQQQHSDGRYRT